MGAIAPIWLRLWLKHFFITTTNHDNRWKRCVCSYLESCFERGLTYSFLIHILICIMWNIGVGVGKVLRVRRIFARIFPNFPETFVCDFAYRFSPTKIMKTFFGVNSKKMSSCVFQQTLGAIFLNQTTLDAVFVRIFRGFALIFRDFAQVFDKSKFWVYPAPQPLAPLMWRSLAFITFSVFHDLGAVILKKVDFTSLNVR